MGCTCSSKKEQSPQKTKKLDRSDSNHLFILIETKIYKFYQPHKKLQNISHSTILTRRRGNNKAKDLEFQETK